MNHKIERLKDVVDRTVNVLGHIQYYVNQAAFVLGSVGIFLEQVNRKEFNSGYIKEQ
jgi:hypothetical protein